MARSKRRAPITGITAAVSDKPSKVRGHRRARVASRAALTAGAELPHAKAYGNPWQGEKDGKQWLGDRHPDLMRK